VQERPALSKVIECRWAFEMLRMILRALWTCVRLAVAAGLVAIEPLVRLLLASLALLFATTALFLELVSVRPIPFLGMLATAIGCVGLLALYQALIRALN
jgi:hypothetical protein